MSKADVEAALVAAQEMLTGEFAGSMWAVCGHKPAPMYRTTEKDLLTGETREVELVRRGSLNGEIANTTEVFVIVGAHKSGIPVYERITTPAHYTNEMVTDKRGRVREFRRFRDEETRNGEFSHFAPAVAIRGLRVTLGWRYEDGMWYPYAHMQPARLTPGMSLRTKHIDEILAHARGEAAPKRDEADERKKRAWAHARKYAKANRRGVVDSKGVREIREILGDHTDADEIIERIVAREEW